MPLTDFQAQLAQLLAQNRTPDSHLAGGAALHFSPNSQRYSNDLDYFHDSVERVATAFSDDEKLLQIHAYEVSIEVKQPGFIRALISQANERTKVEWSHDSAWRFMPVVRDSRCGYLLHEVDLAINKVLALAGRDEPRDYLDVMYAHEHILELGPMIWAAAGKDPGFTPLSLLELVRRRGKYREEDFLRLRLKNPPNLIEFKKKWLVCLDGVENFVKEMVPFEYGCLFYHLTKKKFVTPNKKELEKENRIVPHYGAPGGVLPLISLP